MRRVLLLTLSKDTLKWSSLGQKLEIIANQLDSAVTVEYADLKPKIRKGRITHAWFDELRKRYPSYDHIAVHMSLAQKREYQIIPTLRGSRLVDQDGVGEMYFWANENTKRGDYNQFIETFLHEMRHELCAQYGIYDDTHQLHKQFGTIVGQFKPFSHATQKRNILKLLIEILLGRKRNLHPVVPVKYLQKISQDYGVKNPIYKKTGVHIGVDLAVPEGTFVYAPWSGEVTHVGNSSELGNFCYFKFNYKNRDRVYRLLHLKDIPKLGEYYRGSVMARSGNTGFSTGEHLHIDAWWENVNIGKINSQNWDQLTFNPLQDQ